MWRVGKPFHCVFMVSVAMAISAQDGLDSYMKNLASAGNLQVERGLSYGDGMDANTRFDLRVQANWSSEYSIVKRGQSFEIVISPKMTRLEVSIEHRMRLSEEETIASNRYRTLVLHEYDHLAISTDERPRILMKSLANSMGTIRRPWKGAIPASLDSVNGIILAELEHRKAEVVRLMEDAYKRLDDASDHGRKSMNRLAFFSSLYGLDQLRAIRFDYLSDAESILKSPDYVAAKRYFRY